MAQFFFFAVVLLFSMVLLHPGFLTISLLGALAYAFMLNASKTAKTMLYMLPVMLLVTFINPFINHKGLTILCYLGDNPITLEALWYGAASAVMFVSVILWFNCFNVIVTSNKLLFLFGKRLPAMALLLSMTFGMVPKFIQQAKKITNSLKGLGLWSADKKAASRIKNGIRVFSALATWALENSIETADSMKARGYGLKGKTSYCMYKWSNRDKRAMGILIVLAGFLVFGTVTGETDMKFFPKMQMAEMTVISRMTMMAYMLLCLFPVAINVWEDLRWQYLKLKI